MVAEGIGQVRSGKNKIKDLGKEVGVTSVYAAGRNIAIEVIERGVKEGLIKAGAKKMARSFAPIAIAARSIDVIPKIHDEVQA